MAVVKNISPDARSVFAPGSPALNVEDEATIPDAQFCERAWPKSTWDLVVPPGKGFVDCSTADAFVFVPDSKPEAPAVENAPRGGKAA